MLGGIVGPRQDAVLRVDTTPPPTSRRNGVVFCPNYGVLASGPFCNGGGYSISNLRPPASSTRRAAPGEQHRPVKPEGAPAVLTWRGLVVNRACLLGVNRVCISSFDSVVASRVITER